MQARLTQAYCVAMGSTRTARTTAAAGASAASGFRFHGCTGSSAACCAASSAPESCGHKAASPAAADGCLAGWLPWWLPPPAAAAGLLLSWSRASAASGAETGSAKRSCRGCCADGDGVSSRPGSAPSAADLTPPSAAGGAGAFVPSAGWEAAGRLPSSCAASSSGSANRPPAIRGIERQSLL